MTFSDQVDGKTKSRNYCKNILDITKTCFIGALFIGTIMEFGFFIILVYKIVKIQKNNIALSNFVTTHFSKQQKNFFYQNAYTYF